MITDGLQEKLAPEHFPEMSDTLRAIVDFMLGSSATEPAITKIELTGEREVRAWFHGAESGVWKAREPDLGAHLRRLASIARLTQTERLDFENLAFRKLGISLAPRYGCKIP